MLVFNSKFKLIAVFSAVALMLPIFAAQADADRGTPLQSASSEKLSEAMGHYSRARALLIAAVNEFDKGLGKVNPEALLQVDNWRGSVIERARELERVLDPQPRASKGGVQYEPDPRLIGEAHRP
ncbi:MAG: hypothetical protein KDD42_01320 [Bdellovibrionales bacterium]|nr:hypothetical protein [Bdellovibrionales bacterium]